MTHLTKPIDEFLLAAYLSRGLPPALRREIEIYLLENSDARDLLGMANDALEEARMMTRSPVRSVLKERDIPVSTKDSSGNASDESARPSTGDRSSSRYRLSLDRVREEIRTRFGHDDQIMGRTVLLAVAFISLVTLLVLLRSVDGSSSDQIARYEVAGSVLNPWVPSLSEDENMLRWSPVVGASSYAIVVLNADEETIVNIVGTKEPWKSDFQDTAYTFRTPNSGVMSVWVVAFDASGGFLRSSAPVILDPTM